MSCKVTLPWTRLSVPTTDGATWVRCFRRSRYDTWIMVSDEVVGMVCINEKETITTLVVSEQGYGKRSNVEDYRMHESWRQRCKDYQSLLDKTGKLVAIKNVTEENDIMIINKSGIAIRTKVTDLSVIGRATQGVRLINLGKRK